MFGEMNPENPEYGYFRGALGTTSGFPWFQSSAFSAANFRGPGRAEPVTTLKVIHTKCFTAFGFILYSKCSPSLNSDSTELEK